MYIDKLNPRDKVNLYEFIETIKSDLPICYPSNHYIRDLFIIQTNSMVDNLQSFIRTEDMEIFKRFERHLSEAINYAEGTTISFLEVMSINLQILIKALLNMEYYEVIGPIEDIEEELKMYLDYIIEKRAS